MSSCRECCDYYRLCMRAKGFDGDPKYCPEALLLEKLEWDAAQEKILEAAYDAKYERLFSEPVEEDE